MASTTRTTITLDCRGFAPPEPLLMTLKSLEQTSTLTGVYDRMPYLLFPELDQRALRYGVEVRNDGVYVRISGRGGRRG
jgi:hypothetical protein